MGTGLNEPCIGEYTEPCCELMKFREMFQEENTDSVSLVSWSDQGFNVHFATRTLHGRSYEITLTVPLSEVENAYSPFKWGGNWNYDVRWNRKKIP